MAIRTGALQSVHLLGCDAVQRIDSEPLCDQCGPIRTDPTSVRLSVASRIDTDVRNDRRSVDSLYPRVAPSILPYDFKGIKISQVISSL